MKVNLFIPCFIDQFYPETAKNTLKILKKIGTFQLIKKLNSLLKKKNIFYLWGIREKKGKEGYFLFLLAQDFFDDGFGQFRNDFPSDSFDNIFGKFVNVFHLRGFFWRCGSRCCFCPLARTLKSTSEIVFLSADRKGDLFLRTWCWGSGRSSNTCGR